MIKTRKQGKVSLLMLSAGLMALTACQTPGPTQPQPQPSATSSPVPEPTVEPGEPTPGPSNEPGPSAEPGPSTDPNPSATPSSDTSIEENTTFNGKIFDDNQTPLNGVTVSVRSLSSNSDYAASTLTAGGNYAFNNAPAGIQLEITASKDGLTTRRRVEVLKSNKQGDPNANRYDFGTDGMPSSFGIAHNALSDKPEVMLVNPGRNASGVAANTPIKLTFSEPMDRNSVLNNVEIRAFSSKTLSVANAVTLTGAGSLATPAAGTQVWDKNAFEASWNEDDTELTLSFKDQRALPSDQESSKTPDYLVSFLAGDGDIQDKSGIKRSADYFKLTEGNFEAAYRFGIQSDSVKPELINLMAHTAENGSSDGDHLRLKFSERMIHYTLGPVIAGGMNGNASQAPAAVGSISAQQAAANYRVSVNRGGNVLMTNMPWSSLGGRATFDTLDASHHTVRLLPPSIEVSTGSQTVGGGANAMQAINGTIYYTDGSTEAINVTPLANTYAALKNALDGLLDGTPFSVTEISNGNGNVDANDSYRIGLAAGAQNLASTKNVTMVLLNASGAFASPDLNAPSGGLRVFPGAAPNLLPDLFQPGDQVQVKVESSVLDPAGNSMQSNKTQLSANAS